MARKRIHWIILGAIWVVSFSGRAPEPHPASDNASGVTTGAPMADGAQGLAAATHADRDAAPAVVSDLRDDAAKPTQAGTATTDAITTRRDKHRWPLALGMGLFAGALLGMGHVHRLRRQRAAKHGNQPRPRRRMLSQGVAIVIVVAVALAIALLGLIPVIAILGLSASAFGWVALAYLFTMLLCGGLAAILYLLLHRQVKAQPDASHKALGGCVSTFVFIAMIPFIVAVGALSMALFLSLLLGVSIGFWLAVAIALIVAATTIGGMAVALILYDSL